jgi:hypothetical protein
MAKPYSMDLRERAMRRVAAGESAHSVAAVLKVSVSSASNGRCANAGPAVLGPARWAGIGRFAYRESVPLRTNAKRFAILRENVGIQFLSLRQRVRVQNSLSPYKRQISQ